MEVVSSIPLLETGKTSSRKQRSYVLGIAVLISAIMMVVVTAAMIGSGAKACEELGLTGAKLFYLVPVVVPVVILLSTWLTGAVLKSKAWSWAGLLAGTLLVCLIAPIPKMMLESKTVRVELESDLTPSVHYTINKNFKGTASSQGPRHENAVYIRKELFDKPLEGRVKKLVSEILSK